MQLLFDSSEELGGAPGLGLIRGGSRAWRPAACASRTSAGTRSGSSAPRPLTAESPGCPFYHVHSFAARPSDPEAVIGTTEYGERFATIVGRDNVFGVQFHPEKSSRHGLRMLESFVELCAGGEAGSARVAA